MRHAFFDNARIFKDFWEKGGGMDIYSFLRVCGQSFIFACGCCRQMRGASLSRGFRALCCRGGRKFFIRIFYTNLLH